MKISSGAAIAFICALWAGMAFSLQGLLTLAVLSGPVVLFLIVHRPAFGLWWLAVAHPFASAYSGLFGWTVNYLIPCLVLAACLLVFVWQRREPYLLPGRLGFWFILFITWMLLTSLFSEKPLASLLTAFRYGLLAAVLVAIVNFWSRQDLEKSLLSLMVVFAAIGLYAAWQAYLFIPSMASLDVTNPNRFYGIYGNPNVLGVVMGHGVVLSGAYFLTMSTKKRTLKRTVFLAGTGFLLVSTLAGLVISISRASFLYAGTALAVLVFSRRELRLPALGAFAGMLGLIALFFPALLVFLVRPRSGISQRDALWRAGWEMLTDHPWTGIGAAGPLFEDLRAQYLATGAHRALLSTQGGQAHNVFLTKGAEMGWIGLLLVLALFGILLKCIPPALRAYRNGDWISGAAAAGFVGLTVRAFFESGGTLGTGHIADSLMFFLYALVLMNPNRDNRFYSAGEPVSLFRQDVAV